MFRFQKMVKPKFSGEFQSYETLHTKFFWNFLKLEILLHAYRQIAILEERVFSKKMKENKILVSWLLVSCKVSVDCIILRLFVHLAPRNLQNCKKNDEKHPKIGSRKLFEFISDFHEITI